MQSPPVATHGWNSTRSPILQTLAEMDRHADVTSAQSALASFQLQQCITPDTYLKTPGGRIRAAEMQKGTELTKLHGGTVKVSTHRNMPELERDSVKISAGTGSFVITADHGLAARWCGKDFSMTQASEVSLGMQLAAMGEPATISEVKKIPAMLTEVVQFELEEPLAMVAIESGGDYVGIFGSQPAKVQFQINHLKGLCDMVEVSSSASQAAVSEPWGRAKARALLSCKDGFPRSVGSHQHPNCAGACNLFKKGRCKYGIFCMSCHTPGCATHKASPGKNQRTRAKKRLRAAPA